MRHRGRGLVGEDRLVGAAQLDAELVHQPGADGGVGPQRLGLPAATVQGEQQPAPQILPVRVLGQQGAQFADRAGVVPPFDALADEPLGGV